jgi:GntR family transcriptional regulator
MRKAGSAVLDRLRDRILVGRYFGQWSSGDRLPSVRDVARIEAVDRKTVAAAYRRLQREGLVRIEPRSGVYVGQDGRPGPDPLRRLHAQWLENALETAWDLGLDAPALARVFSAVAQVQKLPIAVVDADSGHAALLAGELERRTGLRCQAHAPDALSRFRTTTPWGLLVVASPHTAARIAPALHPVPLVWATLSPQLLHALGRAAATGPVTVIVGTEGVEGELRRGLAHGLIEHGERVAITLGRTWRSAGGPPSGLAGRRLIVWPGTFTGRIPHLDGHSLEDMRRVNLLSDATLCRVRAEVARAALDHLSRSSAAGAK